MWESPLARAINLLQALQRLAGAGACGAALLPITPAPEVGAAMDGCRFAEPCNDPVITRAVHGSKCYPCIGKSRPWTGAGSGDGPSVDGSRVRETGSGNGSRPWTGAGSG